ncbi:MAG: hypothetical protein LUE11_06795 [Clostridia bacterium]|nr:hypothetical protein [Clostridia bacterium]
MITAETYEVLLGTSPPDDFDALIMQADAEINRATLYGLIGRDASSFPLFIQNELQLAYAYQVQYLSENAGVLNEAGVQSFTLGKFSASAAARSSESNSGAQTLSPMVKNSLITVNAYLRGLRE